VLQSHGNNRPGSGILIDVTHCLDSSGDVDRVDLDELPPLTALLVWTRNSLYRVVVAEGADVYMQGGTYFPAATSAHLVGASVGDKRWKARCIGVGRHMVIEAGGRRIVTSPVRMICVERAGTPIVH
jgi:hypothetical protein